MRATVLASVVVAGCYVASPRGYVDKRVPNVMIITAAEAAQYKLQGERVELAFGPGRDGTDVVVEFLQEAQRRNSGHVSSLEIHLIVADGNGRADCATAFGPDVEVQQSTSYVTTPGRTVTEGRMRPVTRTVSRSRYECHSESRPHTVTRTEYQSQYDYASKSTRSVPVTRTATEYRSEQVCGSKPYSETVTTYEYQTELKYLPPKTEMISQYHSKWKLVESAPRCTPIDEVAPVQNRVTGVVYKTTKM